MANLNGFNAGDVDPNMVFDAVPAGWYEVMILESEMKATKAQDGNYLELKLQIIEGEHKGRLLWDRLNLDNPNELATQIARGTLSAICRAVGITTPKDSSELHNLPLLAKVATKTYEGELRNEVKGYKPKGGAQAQAQAPAGGAAAPAKPAQSAGPAWMKK